jgi:hypothetical protein
MTEKPLRARRPSQNRGGRIILAAGALALVVAGLVVYLVLPVETGSLGPPPFETLLPPGHPDAAAIVRITIVSIDAAAASADVRIQASPGPVIPSGGAVVFSTLAESPAIVVRPGIPNAEVTTAFAFQSGNVAHYPFDSYRVNFGFLALSGTDTTLANRAARAQLPLEVEGVLNAANWTSTSQGQIGPTGQLNTDLQLQRAVSTQAWVVAMMAIYWMLAIGCVVVTLLVILRLRPFDTRLLTFLGAVLFALVTFRTAAPGNPPIGTSLDYYAMFESVAIVAVSLIALIVVYAARPREWLEL